MLAHGPANAIAFTVPPAELGDSYSLVPASFRTGDPPPAGRNEMLVAIGALGARAHSFRQIIGRDVPVRRREKGATTDRKQL